MTSFKSISEIHDAYDKKVLSPVEFVRDYLDRIRKSDLNAFLEITATQALDTAKIADQILAREGRVPRDSHPLFGIPLGIKDVLVVEGSKTTCASKMLENYRSPYTATAVERLFQAGAIMLGKLNMDEFAMGGSNENSAFGPVKHPVFKDRVAGGSSGGSAAAVAGNLCVASLGTDTGGSIRLPASFCGTVGVKPTYGRVSRYGLVAFASSLDQVGPFGNSVADCGKILDAMTGHDPFDSTSLTTPATIISKTLHKNFEWSSVRIGLPKEYLENASSTLEPAVVKTLESSVSWMQKRGAKIVEVSLPHSKYAVAVYYILAVSEASSNLSRYDGVRYGARPESASRAENPADFYKRVRGLFGPEVKRRIILGTFALSSGYYDAYFRRACQVRRLISQDFKKVFSEVDFIVGPVSTGTAFPLGSLQNDPMKMYLNDLYAIPVNLAGLPALSLPVGKSEIGLPVGLHMIGRAGEDERLMHWAHATEAGMNQ